MHEICEKEAALKEEIKQLKRENGNLKQKICSLENVNHDLTKLIETMSERASDTPGPTDGMTSATSVSVPTVSTANRFTALPPPLTHRFIPSDYKKDGLHLSDVGVAKYAKEIKQKIRSIKLR